MTDLGTLGGSSDASGINNSGQVVGIYDTASNSTPHGFLWQNGTMSDLGTLGGSTSYAVRINQSGQIVGYAATTGNGAMHAVVWQNGIMTDLGAYGNSTSYGSGINNSGQIVGAAFTAPGNNVRHAILWQNGIMTDLNDVTLGSGWILDWAFAINDYGAIVGTGINPSGQTHAFLLTGVPEPSSIALAGLGVAGFAWRWRRRSARRG